MNRAQRRALGKINKRDIDNAVKHLENRQNKLLIEDRVEAMFVCTALALRKLHKFGAKRCLKVLNEIDGEMLLWVRGEVTLEDLKKRASDEIGLGFGSGKEHENG